MCMHLYKGLHQIVPHYATHDIECVKLMENFRYLYDGFIGYTANKGYVSDSIIIKEIMEV